MGSNTPLVSWPYPQSSDLIAQGALNIEQLAEASEGQFFLAYNSKTADDIYSSYPAGMSITQVGGAQGFPAAGQVITWSNVPTKSFVTQIFVRQTANAAAQTMQVRYGYNASDGPTWSAWQTVVSTGTPNAMAAGGVTVSPTAGSPKAVTISFPSNRFQPEDTGGNVRPQLTLGGRTHPENISTCVYSVSNTNMVVYLWCKDSTDTAIGWQATQGLDNSSISLFNAPAAAVTETLWAICETDGCSNQNIPIPVGAPFTDPETGETVDMDYYCGVCGQEITRIVDVKPPEPDPEPQPIE